MSNTFKIKFESIDELRDKLADVYGLVTPQPDMPVGLALFSSEELHAELDARMHAGQAQSAPAANDPAPTLPVDPPKAKRGRPAKKPAALLAGNGAAPAETVTRRRANSTPSPAAVPETPSPAPDKRSESVAPEPPNEDNIMDLMSQVYSASNDMELIRNLMLEVSGKTQLSQIQVTLWPALVTRLEGELARLKGTPA